MRLGVAEKFEKFLINCLAISGNSKHFMFTKEEKRLRGGGAIIFSPNLIFCQLKLVAKFQNPTKLTPEP